ncbi:MAG TPA: NADH-quinone oxidoreductase subunit K, partial [Minicystis sp.]|nr:NADH-quinone oxidoreductase subunit K [Minicystis sp.]
GARRRMNAALDHLPYFVAAWVFAWGVYGVVSSKHLVHMLVCVAVVQSSTYPLLLGVGYLLGAGPPVFHDVPAGTRAVDPIVQAMMLTDVVVEAAVLAVLLAFAVQIGARAGESDPARMRIQRG